MNEGSSEKQIFTLGDNFPSITVQTTKGKIQLPSDFHGHWTILFSHPGDFTPVCTTEFISFQQWTEPFRQLNTKLIGLSIDQVYSHLKWIEWIKQNTGVQITFPVIADPLGSIAKQLNMIHPKKGTRTVRGVFILDDEGKIRQMLYYPQEIGRNIAEIWRSVYALQTASHYGVATPENWPNNSLIGNQVIVPPANSEQEIEKRKIQQQQGKIQCLDWWFCYQSLSGKNNS